MERKVTSLRLQTHASECGSVCIGIILEYFGHYHTNRHLRNECLVGRDGATITQMRHGIEKLGHKLRVAKKGVETLKKNDKPIIIHWNMHHFVVLEGVSSKYAYINDPAIGHYRMTIDAFKKRFTGICIEIICERSHQNRPQLPFLHTCRHYIVNKTGEKRLFFAGLLQGLLIIVVYILLASYCDYLVELEQRFTAFVVSVITLALLVINWLTGRYKNQFIATTIQQFADSLRLRLIKQIMKSNAVSNGFYSSEIHSLIEAFTTHCQNTARLYLKLLLDLAPAFVIFTMLFYINFAIALVTIIPPVIYVLILHQVSKTKRRVAIDLSTTEGEAGMQMLHNVHLFPHYYALGVGEHLLKSALPKTLKLQKNVFEKGIFQLPAESTLTWLDTIQQPLLLLVGFSQILFSQLSFGLTYCSVLTAMVLQNRLKDMVKTAVLYRDSSRGVSNLDDLDAGDSSEPDKSECVDTPSTDISRPAYQALAVEELQYQISPYHPWLFEHVNIILDQGEFLCITGPSGVGKSTLLSLLSLQNRSTHGTIYYSGKPAESHRVGFAFPDELLIFGSLSQFFTTSHQNTTNSKLIQQALKTVELADKLDWFLQNPDDPDFSLQTFSLCEQHRLAIAKAWCFNQNLIFIDEAFGVTEPALAKKIISNMKAEGIAAVLVSHRTDIQKLCDQIIPLTRG